MSREHDWFVDDEWSGNYRPGITGPPDAETGAPNMAAAAVSERGPKYLGNPPACGAPKGSRWGYLPCGCSHDGRGGHLR